MSSTLFLCTPVSESRGKIDSMNQAEIFFYDSPRCETVFVVLEKVIACSPENPFSENSEVEWESV